MAILRTNSSGLIPEELSKSIIQDVVNGSAIMSLSRIEEMTTHEKTISVLEGVTAYFVDEAEAITTNTTANFRPVKLTTSKLAVIVPFSNELLNESITDVIAELKAGITEQFYRKFDVEAVTGAGSVFTKNIRGVIGTSSQHYTLAATPVIEIFEYISDSMGLVEQHGYNVNGFISHHGYKNNIRKLKDHEGNALYSPATANSGADQFYGVPIRYSFGVDKDDTSIITGDWRYSIVGLKNEIQYKVLSEATVGGVNLAEKDMSAIRAIMPIAFAIAKDNAFAELRPVGA